MKVTTLWHSVIDGTLDSHAAYYSLFIEDVVIDH